MSLIDQITALAKPLMQSFHTDLEHDKAWIEGNPHNAFIHVTRQSGTWLIPMPVTGPLVQDELQKHLFGMARPSEIYRQDLRSLKYTLADSGVLWLLYDGKRLKEVSADRAIACFEKQLDSATQQAERIRRGRSRTAA